MHEEQKVMKVTREPDGFYVSVGPFTITKERDDFCFAVSKLLGVEPVPEKGQPRPK